MRKKMFQFWQKKRDSKQDTGVGRQHQTSNLLFWQWFCYLHILHLLRISFYFSESQWTPGCNSIADLSLKIVFWIHKFAVGTHRYWKQRVPGPISSNCKWITVLVWAVTSKHVYLLKTEACIAQKVRTGTSFLPFKIEESSDQSSTNPWPLTRFTLDSIHILNHKLQNTNISIGLHFSFFLFLYILPGAHFRALSAGRGQKLHSSARIYEWILERTSDFSQSARPTGQVLKLGGGGGGGGTSIFWMAGSVFIDWGGGGC